MILFLSCYPPSLPVSRPHSAVASQLVPRGTWRHLVSVSTGAGTAEECGRFSSVPAAGEEAADARLQGVAGVVTHSLREAETLLSVEEFLLAAVLGLWLGAAWPGLWLCAGWFWPVWVWLWGGFCT